MEVHVSNDSQTLICITYIGALLPSTALQPSIKNFTVSTQTKEYQIQALPWIYSMYAMSIFIKTTFPMSVYTSALISTWCSHIMSVSLLLILLWITGVTYVYITYCRFPWKLRLVSLSSPRMAFMWSMSPENGPHSLRQCNVWYSSRFHTLCRFYTLYNCTRWAVRKCLLTIVSVHIRTQILHKFSFHWSDSAPVAYHQWNTYNVFNYVMAYHELILLISSYYSLAYTNTHVYRDSDLLILTRSVV